jgi:hemoglobin/transferrin/lactoferrin receptor protein
MKSLNLTLGMSLALASLALTVPIAYAGEIAEKNSPINNIAQTLKTIQVTGIQLDETESALKVTVKTADGNIPEGEIEEFDSYVIIKLTNTELKLSGGGNYLKDNPIAGINSISVTQSAAKEIQIKITGDGKLPKIEELESSEGLVFSVSTVLKPTTTTSNQSSETPKVENIPNNQKDEAIELTVTGNRDIAETAPANITVINSEQIQKQQARDVRDLVRYEPGVSVPYDSRGGLQGINIRGLGGNRVNMQVDGIRLPDEYNYGATRIGRDYVDIETLNALEIFRGNNSAVLNSDALGGTVNFQTAKTGNLLDILGKDSFTSIRTQYSSKDSGFVGTLTQANRFDNVDTLFVYTRRDSGSLKVAGGNSIYQDDVDRDRNNFLGKLTYNFDKQSFLEFTGEYFNNVANSNFSTANLAGMTFEASSQSLQEKVTTTRGRFSLAYQYDNPNSKSWINFIRAQAYYQNSGITEESQRSVRASGVIRKEEADKDFTDRILGANLQLKSGFNLGSATNTLTYGVDISNAYNERNYNNFTTTTGRRVLATGFPQKDFPDSNTFRLGILILMTYKQIIILSLLKNNGV